jgi:hypothetical protein
MSNKARLPLPGGIAKLLDVQVREIPAVVGGF